MSQPPQNGPRSGATSTLERGSGDKVIIDRVQFLMLLSRVESMLEEVRDLKQTLGKKA